MFHTGAFTASLGNVQNADVPAIADDWLSVQNSHFFPQQDYRLFWAVGIGLAMDRMRIVSPSKRLVSLPLIRPLNVAAAPANITPTADYRDDLFRIFALEELSVNADMNAVGPNRVFCVMGLGDRIDPAPTGDLFTIRATSTTAASVNVWTTLALTFVDTIPQGNFAVVGLEVQSATAIAARLIFENQYMRPGAISITSLANRADVLHRKGGMGLMGTFKAQRTPIPQVLCTAADAAHEVYLDLVRIP